MTINNIKCDNKEKNMKKNKLKKPNLSASDTTDDQKETTPNMHV